MSAKGRPERELPRSAKREGTPVSPERIADTIGTRLERIAALRPEKIALVGGEKEVSFRALDAAATAIARGIHSATQGRPGTVCLLFANKIPAIHAILGASRSGRTYVPLDASDPEDRLRFIAGDCEPAALLTEASLLERAKALAPPGCALIDIGRIEDAGG